jgi:hypothetical protein
MNHFTKYLCLIFFANFLNYTSVFGQRTVDTIAIISKDSNFLKKGVSYDIAQKIDSLKSLGVNKIIHYFSYCEGWPKYMDSLGVYDIHFLLWENNAKFYIQKYVNLNGESFKRPPPNLISAQNIFKFLTDNYSSIRSENIEPFIIKNVIDGIESYSLLFATHENYILVEIYNNEDQFLKSIKDNDLKETKGGELINVNYPYNSRTKLSKLVSLISEVIGPISY